MCNDAMPNGVGEDERWRDWALRIWPAALVAGLVLGIGCAWYELDEHLPLLAAAVLAALGAAYCLGWGRRMALLVLCLLCGVWWGEANCRRERQLLASAPLRPYSEREVMLRGSWENFPQQRPDGWRGIFIVEEVALYDGAERVNLSASSADAERTKGTVPVCNAEQAKNAVPVCNAEQAKRAVPVSGAGSSWYRLPAPGRVLLSAPPANAGSAIRMEVRGRLCALKNSPGRPVGSFDYVRYYRGLGVFHEMRATRTRMLAPRDISEKWRQHIAQLRHRLEALIMQQMPGEEGHLLLGVALGESYRLKPETRADFRASGLSHVLAASGLHLGLVLGFVLMLARICGRSLRAWALPAAAAVWFYAALVGFSASITRAMLMSWLALLALRCGRPAVLGRSLLLAGGLALARQPLTLAQVGFQLSYAAVAGICLLYEPCWRLIDKYCRRYRYLCGAWMRQLGAALALTAAVTAGTGPLLIYHFGDFAWITVLANLVAVPAAGPFLGAGLLACAVQSVHLGAPLWCICRLLADYMLKVAALLGQAAPWHVPHMPVCVLGAYYVAGLGLWLCLSARARLRERRGYISAELDDNAEDGCAV